MFSIHIHRYSEQVPGSYGESWIGMTNSWWYKARCRCGKIKHVKRFSEIERW